MPGRRISHQPTSREPPRDGSNKFRRTLSQGLAFISNPLSQRKTTPGRQTTPRASLAVTAPATNISESSSPRRTEPSMTETRATANIDKDTTSLQPGATPKTVPRSRTLSFLPRPVDSTLRAMPSKIPAPSPPLQARRVSSPRQYITHQAPLQERHVAVKQQRSEYVVDSPSRVVVKSRTTPSLLKAATSSQTGPSNTLNRTYQKTPCVLPVTHKPTLQENMPTNERAFQRLPQISEKNPRRDSLATPTPLRSNTEKDLQRKTLGTPNGLGGMWRSSRALAAANHEVTYHPVDYDSASVTTFNYTALGVDIADTGVALQVRDWMPRLYWAGRFQARYDQWRTEAMASTIKLNAKFQPDDGLSQCSLEQEKLAACYIFAQLQNLCLTDEAADSLWVCRDTQRSHTVDD